jgi:hypothetical protein
MIRALRWGGCIAALLLAVAGPVRAANQDDLELKVKAAFLFNFAKFTTWPPAKLGPADAPLFLCVYGESPIGRVLQDTVRGRTIGGHAIDVLQSSRADELHRCHVVYVGATDEARIVAGLGALSSHGVLTVHEAAAAQPAGVVRFFLSDGGRVRFEVNVTAASREQLTLSSKLLEVSQVVNR